MPGGEYSKIGNDLRRISARIAAANGENAMRAAQRVNYADRIERAVRLIEARGGTGEPPSLAELAAAAALSEYHFHRVFRLMTGESPASAVKRVRLGQSLAGLASGGIGEATARSGYATSQAYARALQSEAGATPSELRDDAQRRAALADRLARPGTTSANAPIEIAVESFEPLRLLALRNVGAYEELNTGYGRLFELVMAQVGMEGIAGIYGLPHDDPRDTDPASCRFTCALATGSAGCAQGELQELVITGGRHAVMVHRGDFDRIHPLIDTLYAWAIDTGTAIAAAPLFIHYLDDPDEVAPEDQRAVICLPITDEGES